ncbi:MAG TPA: hypothetical protein VKQ73_05320 [Stellaceae bacterium]|nr:hypothetical protein [Stellaceae bacterium]
MTDSVEVLPGLIFKRVYVDTFGATMMAFAPPPTEGAPHPTPWAAVRGGFSFEGRVQIELTDMSIWDGLTPSVAVWLVAAVLRLRVAAPIRLAVIGNMPFHEMGGRWKEVKAVAFESAPRQIGAFTANCIEATEVEILWLRNTLPVAARLYRDERFFRAFSLYDQAQWTPTAEIGTVLVWTAIEILFDLTGTLEKTKAICNALSNYVAADRSDRDHAYQVIRKLYYVRGKTIHAGRSMTAPDVIQSFRLASVAFERVLMEGKLPPQQGKTLH